jgi:hypothetical protein
MIWRCGRFREVREYSKGKESEVQVMCRRADRRAFRAKAGGLGKTNSLERAFKPFGRCNR